MMEDDKGIVLDELTPVKVMGATVWFKMNLMDSINIQRGIDELPDKDPISLVNFASEALGKYVVRIDGLKDSDGNPVEWSPDIFWRMSPRQAKALVQAMMAIGDAENPTTDAPTAQPAES